jgi:hypothetical protein
MSADEEPIPLDDVEEPIPLDDEEPIPLGDEEPASGGGFSAIGAEAKQQKARPEFRRPLNNDGAGATRCRLFHSKIADGALKYLEEHINEWIDGGEIEVKHVGHVVGTLTGKSSSEPCLMVMVWY